jgi:hypothetical protein
MRTASEQQAVSIIRHYRGFRDRKLLEKNLEDPDWKYPPYIDKKSNG